MSDRGQLYTLEGITAGLVILLGLFFALQATTATPGATGSMNPHAEQQDRATIQSTLNAMNDSTLRQAVLYWESENESFHSAESVGFYTYGAVSSNDCDIDGSDDPNPPTQFGRTLCQQLGDAYNYNVRIRYDDGSGLARQRLIFQGQSGSGAVSGTASVVLTNDQRLYEESDSPGNPSGETLAAVYNDTSQSFYAPPADGDANDETLYNTLFVEVVVWR